MISFSSCQEAWAKNLGWMSPRNELSRDPMIEARYLLQEAVVNHAFCSTGTAQDSFPRAMDHASLVIFPNSFQGPHDEPQEEAPGGT